MKEAAGEANITVITIVLIAIVLAVGTLIVTNIMKGMTNNKQNMCSQLGGAWNNSVCKCPDNIEIDLDGVSSGDSVSGCDGESHTLG